MDPLFGAVGPEFLLPDRDDLLEGIDQPAAGLESLVAVGATDGDHDADFPQVQMAHAVDECDVDDRPACLASASSSAIFFSAITG